MRTTARLTCGDAFMQLRMPPDPPEKWWTIRSALESPRKTARLCLILLVNGLPFGYVLAAAVVAAVVVAVARH
jgi:hypothetical protein